MKQIELTLKHREKLLEMCKELFPETELSFESDLAEDGMIDINISKPNNLELIHWFQFLMCELIPKFKTFGINIDYWLMTLPSTHIQWNGTKVNHPVDYIYNEFKKLKNAK